MKRQISKTLYKIVSVFLCSALMLSQSGCWNSRELDALAIVRAIGIDTPTGGSGKVQITAQIVKPQQIGSTPKSGSSGDSEAFINETSTGDTVFSAVREMTSKSSRKLYFPHNEILIFGKDTAKGGIQKYLDFFERGHETRNIVLIAVSETSAEELLDVEPALEQVPADDITETIKQYSDSTSQTQDVKLLDFINVYSNKSSSAIAPMLKVVQDGSKKHIEVSGTAVFKADKLIGTLDKSEGRGLMWVLGKVKSGVIVADAPKGNFVSAEIVRSKTKMTPVLENGKVVIKIKITEEGNIDEQIGTENLLGPPEVSDLEHNIAAVIEREINAALKKARELDTDVFQFGSAIEGKYPSEWKKMKDNWDEIFKTLEVELSIEASLRLSGRISKPLAPE